MTESTISASDIKLDTSTGIKILRFSVKAEKVEVTTNS